MKNDVGYFYEITPVIDMEHFVELLLAMMAKETPIINLENPSCKTAVIPSDCKEIIESIMFSDNGWGLKFSALIDSKQYYKHQSKWEMQFGNTIKEVILKLGKVSEYDFCMDNIKISFSTDEIAKIISVYDKEVVDIMEHFSRLIYGFSNRRYRNLSWKEAKRDVQRQYYRSDDNKF